MVRAILAIDQGTTNSKAVLVAENGAVLAQASSPVGISHPQPGWVEQDPRRIWASVLEAIGGCRERAPGVQIVGIAISNQRESVTAWDAKTGEPLGPVLSWQCHRTTQNCAALVEAGHAERVLGLTGLPIDPMFPGPKLRWLMERIPPERRARLGTIDSWLIHCLTDGRVHACDATNAARSQMFDLGEQRWSEELGQIFGVPLDVLPVVRDSSDDFGVTRNVPGIDDGVPIRAAIGDSHAALFGHGAFTPGDGKVTFGTGSSVMTTLPALTLPQHGLTTTIAWQIGGQATYAFEGNILVCAASLPWMTQMLGLSSIDELIGLAKTAEPDGPGFVPAFVGLGAPYWDSHARALFSGITFNTTRAQMARAVTDSIALQVRDVAVAMAAQSNVSTGNLYVDGGPSRNRFLMQCVANLLERPIILRDVAEASALGAALLAGLSLGIWPNLAAIAALPHVGHLLEPEPEDSGSKLATWKDAVARSTFHTTPGMTG